MRTNRIDHTLVTAGLPVSNILVKKTKTKIVVLRFTSTRTIFFMLTENENYRQNKNYRKQNELKRKYYYGSRNVNEISAMQIN